MIEHTLLSRSASLARWFGAVSLADRLWGANRLTVLVYHRIGRYQDVFRNSYGTNISATPEAFRLQMEYIARHFSVIDLQMLVNNVRDGDSLPPRPILVTFDDGYRDNYEFAFPVLKSLGLPAVIFIITGQIDSTLLPWWDECAYYLMNTPLVEADLPLLGRCQLGSTQARQAQIERLLRALKRLPNEEQHRQIEALRRALGLETPINRDLFMTWEQVEEMEHAGISIQPHTMTHPILTRVPFADMCREIQSSKAMVESKLGKKVLAFAYPNGLRGDYDAQTIHCLRDSGYAVAFTMSPGPLHTSRIRQQALEIPRIYMGYWDSFDLFVTKVSGLLHYFYPNILQGSSTGKGILS